MTPPYKNFASIIGLAYNVFVLNPLTAYLYAAQIKIFLGLYELSGLPRWTNYAIFLPLYLFAERVMWQLLLLQQNLSELIFIDMIAGASTGYCGETSTIPGFPDMPVMSANRTCHKIWYNPLYGTTNTFLFLYHDLSKPIPEWYYSWNWYFDKTAWVDALLWIFVVIPITLFTYWVYEPIRLERYRNRVYTFLVQKLFRSKQIQSEIEIHVEQPPGSNNV